jgi:drug/metabolite transporter (DMT)-like permease
LIEVTTVRLLAAVSAQFVFVLAVPKHRKVLRILLPSRAWFTLAPAAFLGSYLAMLMWLGGFKWASTSVAALLNQTSSIFTIVLARLILKEPITQRRALGAALALAGVVWTVLEEQW